MIIFGIDPGTARLGCGIIEVSSKKPRLLHAEVLQTSKDLDAYLRLKFLYKGLRGLIKEFRPNEMVVERLFFNANVKTAMAVGEARGVCLLAAAESKLKIYEYTALEAKSVLTGYGRSDKKQMQESVRQFLMLEDIIKSDDANDAVAMALCHLQKTYV